MTGRELIQSLTAINIGVHNELINICPPELPAFPGIAEPALLLSINLLHAAMPDMLLI